MNGYIWLWVVELVVLFGVVGYFSFRLSKAVTHLLDGDESVSEETPCKEDFRLKGVMERFGVSHGGVLLFDYRYTLSDMTLSEKEVYCVISEVGGKWKTSRVRNEGRSLDRSLYHKEYYSYNDLTYEDGCKVGDHYYFKGKYLTPCEWSLLRMFIDQPERFDINTRRCCGGKIDTTVISIYDKDTAIPFTQEHSSVNLGDKVTFEGWKLIVKEVCLAEDRKFRQVLQEAKKAKEEKMLSLYCKCED